MSDYKLVGAYVTHHRQIEEIAHVSNAAAFRPENTTDLYRYLDTIDRRLVPVIQIDNFYLENGKYVYRNQTAIENILKYYKGRKVIMFDEPYWKARNSGQPKHEVTEVLHKIKASYPDCEFFHVESFAELHKQQEENNGQLTLYYPADHIGFNCYGSFDSCGGAGVPPKPQFDYLLSLYNNIALNGSKAKIFLVPGAFTGTESMQDPKLIIEQLDAYAKTAEQYWDYISGFGVFTWGNVGQDITGARNHPSLRAATHNILYRILNHTPGAY